MTGCTVNKNLYIVGNQIWYEKISPDYDNSILQMYELEQKVTDIPFEGSKYISEKRYNGIKKEDGSFDTLKLNQGPFERYLNNENYTYLYNRSMGNGSAIYTDSLFYEYYRNKLLKTVIKKNVNMPGGGITWKIDYNRNRLIKKHTLYKDNGRLIAEKLFDYPHFTKKVISTTRYGKENILTRSIYEYNDDGRIITEIIHQYLTKNTGKIMYEYFKNGDYLKKVQWIDSNDSIKTEVNEKYVNNQLVERLYIKKDGYRIDKNMELLKYYEDSRLKEKVSKSSSIPIKPDKRIVYPEWDDFNTSRTLYFYKTDSIKKEVWIIRNYLNNRNSGNVSIDIFNYK